MITFTVNGVRGTYFVESDTVHWDTITCCYADAPKTLRSAIRLNRWQVR